jgi:Na+/proline symporter
MVVGFLVTVIWVVAFKTDFYDLYEMIPGFIAGLGTIVVVSLVTSDRSGGQAVRRSDGP